MMKYINTINYKHLYEIIESYSAFYDHPLSGFCIYNRKRLWFVWKYEDEVVNLYKLNFKTQTLRLWRRFLFELMISRNCRYKPPYLGKHEFLFNLYYHSKFFKKYVLVKNEN